MFEGLGNIAGILKQAKSLQQNMQQAKANDDTKAATDG